MYCSNILQLARTREKPLPTMTDEIEARAIAANVAKLPEFLRRVPPPWSVEELKACFVVKDSAGQKLA
jgi:hypothetical protein